MAGLYDDAFIETLRAGAASLAPEWGHRPGYHTRAEIESELAWIEALRAEAVVDIPRPLPCRSGGHIAGFDLGGETRDVVAFEFMAGDEPSPTDHLVEGFRKLGAISARLHEHVRRWEPPSGFTRKTWTWETTVGPQPLWGDWRAALGLTPDGKETLERVTLALRDSLAAYGTAEDRFGLVHADLRLANLLVDANGHIGVIDFDDCGFSWFMYDFAAAISFIELDPQIPALREAWVEGYRSAAPLGDGHVSMLDTFVMLRRLLLTAWIASHSETPTAQEFGTGYTDGTVAMAERYLARS